MIGVKTPQCEKPPVDTSKANSAPQCENLPVDTSKANPGSQKAAPINAWLLAQGSYKRQNALLIQTSIVATSQAAAIIVGIQNKHASWKALKLPNAQW